MTKSLVSYILSTTDAILADHVRVCPTARVGAARDLSRLTHLGQSRGLPTFTLDLPALGKHFDKCLANGLYTKFDGPLSGRHRPGSPIPRLFSGLMLDVFDLNGMLRSSPCVQAIATLRQLYNLAKKLEVACDESRTIKSVRDFYTIESSLPAPTLEWGAERLGSSDERLDFQSYRPITGPGLFSTNAVEFPQCLDLRVCQFVFDVLSTTLGIFSPYDSRFKHGSGAVADLRVGQSYKYDFPTWSARLEQFFHSADFGYSNYSSWIEACNSGSTPLEQDVPAELLAVPKTQKGPRLIAKEPTANQWCQQALLDFLATRMRHTFIGGSVRLRDQTQNRDMACSASRTSSHWTVDLSAASDRVTCRFVERAFRANPVLLDFLNACRTSHLSQKLDKKSPSLVKLKKFSTMGSACTFPIESLAFLGLAISAVIIHRRLKLSSKSVKLVAKQVSVYGDDILVPADSGQVLLDLLTHFDFTVNEDKTFTTGRFRESCGMEAFNGVDVTPVYLRKLPEVCKPASIIGTVETSNNFFIRGWWLASDYIKRRIPSVGILTVAMDASAFGFKSYTGTPVVKKKHDKDIQVDYVEGPMLSARSTRREPGGHAALLQYFTEAPDPASMLDWKSGYEERPRLSLRRGRVYVSTLGKTVCA